MATFTISITIGKFNDGIDATTDTKTFTTTDQRMIDFLDDLLTQHGEGETKPMTRQEVATINIQFEYSIPTPEIMPFQSVSDELLSETLNIEIIKLLKEHGKEINRFIFKI